MAYSSAIAKRYVKALFELADAGGKVDAIAKNFRDLDAIMSESGELRRMMEGSSISRPRQKDAMSAILERAGADALMLQFIGILCLNGRLSILPQITKEFLADLAKRRGEVSAEVISAAVLDASHQAHITEAISRITQSDKVALRASVDASLIGGLVVRIGSRMIDTSIKTKLNRLEAAMKGVG